MAEPVGLALIGLGKWSRQLAAAAQRSADVWLAACYTRTAETRATFAAEFGCLDAASLEDALSAPGVEAAVIAAPAHVHAELTLACAERGVHVLVEKPMALSVEDGRRMADACAQHGVTLMVGHEMRRLGSARAAKRALDAGRLGRVVSAAGTMTLAGTFHPDNWRCFRESNRGGALMQLGIHPIETFNYLLGEPVSVRGVFANAAAPRAVDDVGIATIEYAGGAQAVVTSNYVSPSAYHFHLYGDAANLACEPDMRVWPNALEVDPNTRLEIRTRTTREPLDVEPHDVLVEQYADFARSIRQGTTPETGAREGLMALAVVEAALRAFASGQPVDPRQLLSA